MKKNIYVTEADFLKLEAMMLFHRENPRLAEHISALADELDEAVLLEADEMPDHIITMHSRVELRNLDTGKREVFTLVYPEEANFELGKISILAPLGVAMIGQEIGDVIETGNASPRLSYNVEAVLYQPAANGVFEED